MLQGIIRDRFSIAGNHPNCLML